MFVTDIGDLVIFGDRLGKLGGIVSSGVFLGKVYGLPWYGH